MKKITFLMTFLVIISIFAGCSKNAEATISVGNSNSSDTVLAVDISIADNWYPEEDSHKWQESQKMGTDISVDTYLLGYPEINLDAEQDASDYLTDIKYYNRDDDIMLTFTYVMPEYNSYESYWELHAQHSDAPINISGYPLTKSDMYFSTLRQDSLQYYAFALENSEDYRIVTIMYAEKTGNVYSLCCKNPLIIDNEDRQREPNIVFAYDETMPMLPEGFWQMTDEGFIVSPKKPVIAEFKLYTGEEYKTYQYRTGTTFAEWVNSDLNTDGWFYGKAITEEGLTNAFISPDGNYYSYDMLILPVVTADKTQSTAEKPQRKYIENVLYCFDAKSPLRIAEMQVLSKSFPDNPGLPFTNEVYLPLGINDDITINLDVYYDDIIQDVEVYFAPNSENTTEIPTNSTKYDVEAKTIERDYSLKAKEVRVASLNYKPSEDPNFTAFSGMDMYITYQGQVVYKFMFSQFCNN